MLFCVPDIAILFISLLSCKHANFIIKKIFIGSHSRCPPTQIKGEKVNNRAPQDLITMNIKLLDNSV